MKTLFSLEKTVTRPEEMRVVLDGSLYLVQVLSDYPIKTEPRWITVAIHPKESDAIRDCENWY